MSQTSARDGLLDAAEHRFAEQGFAGTTIKQVAGDAGVNTALLYYYFPDKEGLYRAVLDRLVDRLVAIGTTALDAEDDPVAAVRGLVLAQARMLATHPALVGIMAREFLDAAHSRVGEQMRRMGSRLFARLCGTIRRGQRTGVFRADLDPRFAAISLIGQQVYFYLAHPAVRILLEQERMRLTDRTRAAFADHVAEFSLAALRAPARKVRP